MTPAASCDPTNDCEAVIVNYRSPELVLQCVESIRAQAILPDDRVIVVENGSGDGSEARLLSALPDIRLVVATDNRGFGAGVNLGVAEARGEFVLVLNPDTRFVDRSLVKALELLRANPSIGIVGLDLRNVDASRQYSARRFYTILDIIVRRTPLKRLGPFAGRNAHHLMMRNWSGETFEADWVMGTGFVVRRDAFQAVAGMDTGFFLYMEDVDLCRRIADAGWRVVVSVDSVLIHDHQRTSASEPLSRSGLIHLRSLARYVRKHGMRLL